jgi:short-chain Z-isoprenyl diphosphate synthase
MIGAILKNIVKRPFYFFYQQRLEAASKSWNVPEHVGIILDGNRRFAKMMGMSNVLSGHQRGADKIYDVLTWCLNYKIKVVSIWIFSLDNFNRETSEVEGLLKLIEEKVQTLVDMPEIMDNEVKVKFVGRLDLLPESLQKTIADSEKATEHFDNFQLNVAIAYGGREEIGDAFKDYLSHEEKVGKSLGEIAESFQPDDLNDFLYTADVPDPDLIIRTSGEIRLSGFMLWQSAYSEYYFCDTHWPLFRRIDFLRAMRSFDQRKRRFGK